MTNAAGELEVILGHSAYQDLQLIGQALETARIRVVTWAADATALADQARALAVDCVLFSPTLPGMTPGLINELLLNEEHPIASLGLLPAGSNYAAEYSRVGMGAFITTPVDAIQVGRLPDLVRGTVERAQAERNARSFTPVTAQDALAILDRGGWQQQTIAVYSPKGGAGKSTLAVNLACAFGVLAQRPTLLVDADVSRANAHVLMGVNIPDVPSSNLFALYERVVADGTRTGRFQVRAQTLKEAVRPYRGKLAFLPGIPQMHMAGLPVFVEDPPRTLDIFTDLLREARGYYEFRIIDTGPDFNAWIHWAALSNADTVLLVATAERTTLTDLQNLLPALAKAFGSLQRFRLVLNGYDEKFGFSLKDINAFLGGQVTLIGKPLPWDPDPVRVALNAQKPIVLEKTLVPFAAGVVQLAAQFYPALEALLRKKAVKKPGLFSQAKDVLVGERR